MDRTTPATANEEIELYIRTYYSLLRSSGPVRLRSLEETHAAMNSNLHHDADGPGLDITALTYSALRLPTCVCSVRLVVMGQMEEVFWRKGYRDVEQWEQVRARARRRKYYISPDRHVLACFIASVSDIDDLIPSLVAYQIEWNKMYQRLSLAPVGAQLLRFSSSSGYLPVEFMDELRQALGLSSQDFAKLAQIWPGDLLLENMRRAAASPLDIRVNVLGSGLSDYRRAVQFWWTQIVQDCRGVDLCNRPIYFVSSNTHALPNLLSGYSSRYRGKILAYIEAENPEDLWTEYQRLQREGSTQLENLLYYAARLYLASPQNAAALPEALLCEAEAGVVRITEPRCLDVAAQIIDIRKLCRERLDPRLDRFSDEEWALLGSSDALIFNIDYPLGMAAYHIFSQVSAAVSGILGVYILGKAASLNGRVGDVMLPNVIYDEHSRNSFLFRNCFTAQDLASLLNYGTVFDNQKAVTVRGTFLQNRQFMHVFYEEGYTDIEMESGPYLSGVYEHIYPRRYPINEIVNLFINAPYDIGVLHYTSDTPISRRQTLLSKSMSYFGVDATYATSIAALRRILRQELTRQAATHGTHRDLQPSGEPNRPAALARSEEG